MKINIDGKVYDPGHAKISVLDHAFLFGDSIYEVLRTIKGVLEDYELHFHRLQDSARFIHLELPHDGAFYRKEIEKTCRALAVRDAAIRWIVTRGVGELSLNPTGCKPSFVIIARALDLAVIPPFVKLVIIRRITSDQLSVDPRLKTGNRLPHVLAMHEVKTSGGYEALLKNREGYLAEGLTSSFFFVCGNQLYTPSLETGILNGLTRRRVLDGARRLGIPTEQGKYPEEILRHADAAFICSSTRGIVPADAIDDLSFNSRGNQILASLDQQIEK
ncbi:MAG TPA: aminotransferase class IV [Acidobacteriota bacterium]|jgi:branched-subunit amino acid aminotransferase/4-amino-4-deoxychorismate lyase|nr:aminotransferase class IV [Acidobacteriota bacterium]